MDISQTPRSEIICKFTPEFGRLSKNYLVILDLNMPEINGWQFLDAIKELPCTSTKVVIVSSSINIADREKAKTYSPVINFITKPLKEQNLIALNKYVEEKI